jgi:hypothetical protein
LVEQIQRRVELCALPRHFRTICKLIDSQPHAREDIVDPHPTLARDFRKSLSVRGVRTGLVGANSTWSGIERDQTVRIGLYKR